MRTVQNLLTAVERIDIKSTAVDSLQENLAEFGSKNLEQLYDGKTRDGNDLSPTYLEDPYFKTIEAAQRYSDWKDEITPNPKRGKNVPNLFINGRYYESRDVHILADNIVYSATFKGDEIEKKYGEEINGLGGEYKSDFIDDNLFPSFLNKMVMQLNKK